jgi:hypothetical protein
MLVTAQTLSWSASPLFLCVADDGSRCIDLGPRSCECCHHHGHEAAHAHRQAIAADRGTACGECAHIQITVSWTAGTTAEKQLAKLIVSQPLVSVAEAASLCQPMAWDRIGAWLNGQTGRFAFHSPLATVILRC